MAETAMPIVFAATFFGPRPEIVCLCGSTRFRSTFERLNFVLTMRGKIVLAPGVFVHDDDPPLGAAVDKVALDQLHRRKIDLADRVLVLNVDGYVGDSTRAEIRYAQRLGKRIDFLEAASLNRGEGTDA